MPMKFRMSSGGVVEANVSGSRDAGFSSGSAEPPARARALPDRRPRPRRLDPLANGALERGDLWRMRLSDRTRWPACIRRAPPRADPAPRYSPRLIEVRARGGQHRALERDLIVGVVRLGLHGLAVSRDGLIEIAGFIAASPSRNACPAAQPAASNGRSRDSISKASSSVSSHSPRNSSARQPNRLPSSPIEVRHFDRFGADPQNTESALDDIPFAAVKTLRPSLNTAIFWADCHGSCRRR